jgi:ribosomal protein S18 acetylase RimI-like enzyme
METVELWVTRGNDAAVHLYEAAGFSLTGDHQPLSSDPCKDELRMRLPLD